MIKDKQLTLDKAMKAASDGNAEDASFLFWLHSRMIIPTKATKLNETSIPIMSLAKDKLSTRVKEVCDKEDELPFVENGITFMPGKHDVVMQYN